MNPLKRFVSSFVTVATVIWSMGGALLFPSVAQAATLSPGDLIKASGPAVYYYASDGKRYVFPNEKTYFSWYSDFSSVITITDAELAAILIGGNVTIRPGTKLVKITTDPKTYAVSNNCGLLHWIESESLAQQLYGDNWNQRIVDVPDAFFVDYSIGSSISSAVHPNGQLINYAGALDTYYVVMNGLKRELTGSSIADNMLDVSNAVTTDITYSDGVDVTGTEVELSTLACETAAPSITGGVTVTLASDTPAGKTVPRNSSSNPLIKVNLTAGSEAARINGLRFKRVGTGSASDFQNVYLYDENLVRLTTGRTINSTTHQVEFNSVDLDIPANETRSVYVYGDFSVSSGSEGGVHAIQIADAASVMIEGTGSVSGTFPITGNSFTVGAVAAARVDVNKGVTPSNPTVGAKGIEVSNFRITANTNDVEIRQINLYQAGTINNTDLTNFQLVQGTTVVATASGVSGDNLITLVFDPPFTIGNGVTKVFSLKADVAGRSSRTIRTYIEYTTDVTAIDKVYNSGAAICIGNAATDGGCTAASQGSFDGGTSSEYIEVTTQGGQLTVSFNGPSASNVAKGSLGVTLFQFALTSEESELEIRNLRFTLAGASTGNAKVKGASGTEYFRNFKLVDTDTGKTVMGPIGMGSSVASPATTTGETVFTDSWNLTGGATRNLAIVADLANSEDQTNEFYGTGQSAYTLTLNAFGSSDIRVSDTGEFLATTDIVPNTSIAGNAQTVKAASLSVELATDPAGTTIVKKQQGVPSVGLTLSAGQQSDVTVTSIKVTGMAQTQAGTYTIGKFDQLIIKVSLWDGDTQLGSAKVPSDGEATITNFQLTIPKGTSKNLVVKADVSSTISTTTSTDNYAIGVAANADVTAQDEDANSVTASVSSGLISNAAASGQTVVMSVRNSGTINYQQNNHPVSSIIVGGGDTWKVMARFKATAQYEAVTIDRLAVIHPNDGGTNADFTTIAVSSGGDTTNRTAILSSGTTSTKDIDLSQNPIEVPKDGSIDIELWAKLAAPVSTSSATTYSPRSGDTPSLGVATDTQTGEWDSNYDNQLNVRATGDASGERLYASSTTSLTLYGNTQVLRNGKPVVTKLAPSSNVITTGAAADLYKFQVNSEAGGENISWMQIMFSITTSTGVSSLNTFKFFKGSQELTANTQVFIRDWAGRDLTGSTSLNSDGVSGNLGNVVVVRLVTEETVGTGGTTYTLRATPTLVSDTTTKTVTTSFYRPSASVVTGYLTDDGGPGQFGHALGVDTSVAPDDLSNTTGTFVWSDNVDVPHSYASGTSNGSRDWTNDVYVESLNDSQTLTN